MKIDLQGVPLVAGRPLEVNTIGQDLALTLLHENARAERAPARRR